MWPTGQVGHPTDHFTVHLKQIQNNIERKLYLKNILKKKQEIHLQGKKARKSNCIKVKEHLWVKGKW